MWIQNHLWKVRPRSAVHLTTAVAKLQRNEIA